MDGRSHSYPVSHDVFSPAEFLSCQTYRRDRTATIVFWALSVLTLGLFYWLPRAAVYEWAFRFQHSPCKASKAGAALVRLSQGRVEHTKIHSLTVPEDLMEEVEGGRPYACPEVVLDKMPHVHRMSYRVSMRAKTAEEPYSRVQRVRMFAHGGRNYVYVRR
ncbi:MAG: hypothetical protein KVP17_000939 [Porospora cf. gigantea B]|uniref:uncharacterized protein n=1 Tax=Porospora cf. gigantea B TaxID=2853592 RepID=UPI003571ACC2|nr:MAG: hypothetical protein KVP17_000939 [Porospora cf. gigantea B]